jgi:hypothetical protein
MALQAVYFTERFLCLFAFQGILCFEFLRTDISGRGVDLFSTALGLGS